MGTPFFFFLSECANNFIKGTVCPLAVKAHRSSHQKQFVTYRAGAARSSSFPFIVSLSYLLILYVCDIYHINMKCCRQDAEVRLADGTTVCVQRQTAWSALLCVCVRAVRRPCPAGCADPAVVLWRFLGPPLGPLGALHPLFFSSRIQREGGENYTSVGPVHRIFGRVSVGVCVCVCV